MALAAVPGGPARAAVPPVPASAGQFYPARGPVADALKIAKGATATVDVTGVAGIPASGVASVALNIAVKGDNTAGELIAYPSGAAKPVYTSIRFHPNIYTQNLLWIKVGADGNIKINNDDGTAPVTVYADVHGYTLNAAGGTAGATFVPLKAARIADKLSIPANGTVTFAPLGKGGLPTTGVSHAVFTMAARSDTAGKITVYPTGTAKPGDTNLDYGLNIYHQNQVYARLGADGKVFINNAGTKAVAVDLDVSGYFATPQAPVAGSTYQPLQPARLVANASLAAGATYTLDPLGKGGIPATGVAGVALNFTTRNPGTGYGSLRAFPAGTPITLVHTVAVHQQRFYSGSLTAKLGDDGKITILSTTSATSFWVDVVGYFKAPANCGAGPATTPAVPNEEYAPTAAMQASPLSPTSTGTLEYAYTDKLGRMMHGHQENPEAFDQVQWTPIHESEAYVGAPGLSEQADGRLHLVAHNRNGNVATRTQAARVPASWAPWADFAPVMASHPTVVRQDDTVVAFAVSTTGRLWALPQYSPNGPGGGWIDLGLSGLTGVTKPVAVPIARGIQVFALDAAGSWRTALYARGELSGCTTLAGSGFSGQPAVVVYPGSKLRIFARNAAGAIVTQVQDNAGNWPATWSAVGAAFTAAGSPAAVLNPGSGKTEVVARGTDDVVYATSETGQVTGVWGNWVDTRKTEDGDFTISATDPTAFEFTNSLGPRWGFVIRTSDQVHRAYVRNTASGAAARSATPPAFQAHTLPRPPVR